MISRARWVDFGIGLCAATLSLHCGDSGEGPGGGGQTGGAPSGGQGQGAAGAQSNTGGAGGEAESGGAGPGGGGSVDPNMPCADMAVAMNTDLAGYQVDEYTWRDARCRPRTAAMVHNDVVDPSGHHGGYLRQYRYEPTEGTTRTATGSFDGHPGFGYTVNHWGDTATLGSQYGGTTALPLQGKNHRIVRYSQMQPIDGQTVKVTVEWFFASGRTNPVWSVTYDLTGVPANSVTADTRSPYGDIGWDGDTGGDVDGVGWGDRYKFKTVGDGPVTLDSGWDYSEPNTVPYVLEWSASANAEMGTVQTQTYAQHDAGGYWFYGSWGTSQPSGPMPQDWNWTYQLNQYELPFVTNSHRLAWGANYGAVGQTQYNAYGDDKTLSGYPYQSYSVFIVLGTHSEEAVAAQVHEVEAVQSTSLTASQGTVRTKGPAGVARTDEAQYQPAGYDPIRATWQIDADGGAFAITFNVGTGSLETPVLAVHGWSAADPPATLQVGDAVFENGKGFLASVDPTTSTLWLTLRTTMTGQVEVRTP
ncbi:MAG: hypothetical protein U0271_05135 [Polyangiaceae bacterium]